MSIYLSVYLSFYRSICIDGELPTFFFWDCYVVIQSFPFNGIKFEQSRVKHQKTPVSPTTFEHSEDANLGDNPGGLLSTSPGEGEEPSTEAGEGFCQRGARQSLPVDRLLNGRTHHPSHHEHVKWDIYLSVCLSVCRSESI